MTVDETLRNLHLDLMNGADLLAAFSVVEDFWDRGMLTTEQAEQWNLDLKQCPEGYDLHIGARAWCAYCGDINSHTCGNCGIEVDFRNSGEEYCFMEAQCSEGHSGTYCPKCWIFIGWPYVRYDCSTDKYGVARVVALDRGNEPNNVRPCPLCHVIVVHPHPNVTAPCALCYYSEKGYRLGGKYALEALEREHSGLPMLGSSQPSELRWADGSRAGQTVRS